MDFAVMDDSLARKGDLFVYTHCLINSDELPEVLVIVGNNKSIYDEKKIYDFVELNLRSPEFYACSHYFRYSAIVNDFIDFVAYNKMQRGIKRLFDQAHNTAKFAANNELENILNQTLINNDSNN
ncbi:hypothetical protein C0585_03725 [Candidatus Woesearchaeota archaeon]|nr:MAG: hypothetical protein C0585_03725 [Candidatus Woesearchaeota archaeon]